MVVVVTVISFDVVDRRIMGRSRGVGLFGGRGEGAHTWDNRGGAGGSEKNEDKLSQSKLDRIHAYAYTEGGDSADEPTQRKLNESF